VRRAAKRRSGPSRISAFDQLVRPAITRQLPYREQSSQSGVLHAAKSWEEKMNGLIYLVGLIVVVLFILSFFGLR
jgi:hypothetical protein